MRAGRAAGLVVKAEIAVDVPNERGLIQRGEMDCGWYSPKGELVVAWEFDGRDADDWHLLGGRKTTSSGREVLKLGNARKFSACGAPLKVQVFYSLKNDLTPKPPARPALNQLLFPDVDVVSDEQLMRAGGIEMYIERARNKAGIVGIQAV